MTNISQTLNFLASAGPLANTTVTSEEADAIMLETDGLLIARGVLYNIKCSRVSPSVHRLSLKRCN